MTRTQQEHWEYTTHEWKNSHYFNTIISVLRENKIKSFVDIGANVGAVSKILLDEIPTVEMAFLFEPHKENFSYMFDIFKDEKRAKCFNYGIYYGKTHSKGFRLCSNLNIGGFSVEDLGSKDIIQETSDYFQLFELEFFNFGNVDFVKIDIEGSEWNLLENSSLLKTVPFIEIELHGDRFDKNYFTHHLPMHEILWYSNYIHDNGKEETNHLFLQKTK